MATTARLGIDIVGTDRTRAGFASVQRSMAGLNRTANQLKGAFAGLVGGNILAGFIRSLVRVNKDVPAVNTALTNLSRAWQGFALKVGEGGLNEALINFSNRMGAMIMGTDGLSKSIGAFLGGAVNVMAATFEGIGRAIAFTYDNLALLGRILPAIAFAVAARHILGIGAAMVRFGIAVRQAGILLAAFRAVSNASLYTFLLLGAGIAMATGKVDEMKAGIDKIWQTVKTTFPMIVDAGKKLGEEFGVDFTAISNGFADTDKYLASLPAIAAPATQATAKLGKTTKAAALNIKELSVAGQESSSVFKDVGQAFSSSFGTAFSSLIDGTASMKSAFSDMVMSILKDLTNLFANSAVQQLFGGGSGGGGILGSLFQNLFSGPATPAGSLNFGGPRAAGGPVSAGKSYLVGERGPELFAPGSSGAIIPSRGMGVPIVNIIDQRQNAPRVETRQDGNGNITAIIRDQVNSLIASGQTDRAQRSRFGAVPSPNRR